MSIFSFISEIISPVSNIIDELHVSEEEKLKLRNELANIQAEVTKSQYQLEERIAELQAKLAESASNVAIAESKSDSIFTKTYRPAIITCMFIMISLNSFGILAIPLPDIFISVFGASFGVVALGRSVEKVQRIKKQ